LSDFLDAMVNNLAPDFFLPLAVFAPIRSPTNHDDCSICPIPAPLASGAIDGPPDYRFIAHLGCSGISLHSNSRLVPNCKVGMSRSLGKLPVSYRSRMLWFVSNCVYFPSSVLGYLGKFDLVKEDVMLSYCTRFRPPSI